MNQLRMCTNGRAGWAAVGSLGVMIALVAGAFASWEVSKPGTSPAKATTGKPASSLRLSGDEGGIAGTCPASQCVAGACTLTQSLDTVTDAGNQIACGVAGVGTTANGWARCYNLAAEGVPAGNFSVDSVTFGVQQATIDGINIDVILYLDTDGCPPTNVGVDAVVLCRESTVVNMADEGSMITVPFPGGPVVPSGTDLIVEIISVDDGTLAPEFQFRSMSNGPLPGQCGTSYIRTPDGDCGLGGWTDLATIGFPDSHLVQIVNGTVGGTAAVCGNGIVEGCEECDPPDGATCDSGCRLLPTGACCNSDGAGGCAEMSADACAATGTGGYLGDGTDCVDCGPVACGPGAGLCDEPNGTPGCEDVECCTAVCSLPGQFCCTLGWDQTCVEIALGLVECQASPDPIFIATGSSSSLDGYLDVSPDVFGSYSSTTFGGQGDHYNPVGPATSAEAAFSAGLYYFSGGSQRELLSAIQDWVDVFGPDGSVTTLVTAANSASDTNADGVNDTLTSAFKVFGGATELLFEVEQHVERIIPLGGNPVAILTQTYVITNDGAAITFELVSAFDGDFSWVGDATDDSVGTGTNGSPALDRFVFEQEDADSATAITISSAGGGAYAGSKGGINPDPGDPNCPEYAFGTDLQVWEAFGIPTCWRNHVAGIGYDTDGESGATPTGCAGGTGDCDALALLEIPITLGAGASTTVTVTHTYGANTPGGGGGPACPWDLNGDTSVGILDLLSLLTAWGTNPGGPPDFDGDGNVGILDLLALLTNWGPCP